MSHRACINREPSTAPKMGDEVEHYVDFDTGIVRRVEEELDGSIVLAVQWSDCDEDDLQEHLIDELSKLS